MINLSEERFHHRKGNLAFQKRSAVVLKGKCANVCKLLGDTSKMKWIDDGWRDK